MMRAAIFDIDGTILDSMPVWQDVGARYLRAAGIEPEPGLAAILLPLSMEEGAAWLKAHYPLPESETEIRRGVERLLEKAYREEIPLKPGVHDFLEHLKASGVTLALATAGSEELAKAALTRCGVWDCFVGISTCTALHTTKEEPLIYLEAARLLGSSPSETWVFEDSLAAIRTAKRAGFHTVGVEDAASARDREVIRAESEKYIADYYAELRRIRAE